MSAYRLLRKLPRQSLPRLWSAGGISLTGRVLGDEPLRLMGLAVCLLIVLSIAGSSGCVRRSMLIRSQPAGAVAYVDQQEVGVTPLRVPFVYYGAHRIRLEKDGFETVEVDQRIDAPWYQVPPLDFFSENLWPQEIRDDRIIDFQLQPQQQVREFEFRERAEQFRGNVQSGTVAPLINQSNAYRAVTETIPGEGLLPGPPR